MYAVSSSVAVPCVMTKPARSGFSSAVLSISSTNSIHSAGPMAGLPTAL